MANAHVATYLNDHLAGSVGALELLEQLETAHTGTPLGAAIGGLRTEIAADQHELERLMERLAVTRSRTRRATAWLAEKAAALKLALDDSSDGTFRLLESLEALAIGVDGKLALWQALAVAADEAPALRVLDYESLTERAEDQRCRIEELRLDAAKRALTADS
jgi:hypothetical protein